MKRYESPKPGVAFAFAAVAMTCVTMIAFVMLPAELEAFGHFARRVASVPAPATPAARVPPPVAGLSGIAPSPDGGDGGNARQS